VSASWPPVVTGAEMTAVDRHAIDVAGIPSLQLMERAGARVVETVQERFGGLEALSVGVVAGKGNNGGDGLVVARRILEAGGQARVWLTVGEESLGTEAAGLLRRFREVGGVVTALPEGAGAVAALREVDVVVDALLGTGLSGTPRPPQIAAIRAMNDAGRPVVAVDLPSGVDAGTGQVAAEAVRAAVTVTFGLVKVGHLFAPGRGHCGALDVVDIGFPDESVRAGAGPVRLLTEGGVAARMPYRPADAHKGTCGAVFVLAGSAGMTGAACLAAESALRGGAGRVTLGAPASLNDILEVKLTEVMTLALPEVRRRRCLSLRALGDLLAPARRADALVVGPGIGRHRETAELVRRLLASPDLPPAVIDADGLHALGEGGDVPPGSVLTPHAGEFARLAGLDRAAVEATPLKHAPHLARRLASVVVLKGGPTVIAAPDGGTWVNPTGNPGMATAGTGDVLAGLIGGLLAQGLPPLEAAQVGVFLHGRAGDLARDDLGEWSLRAGDLCRSLGGAFVATAASARSS
jgi:hydroxyethylthiazole kinase-like uncharacterized protein yjeF